MADKKAPMRMYHYLSRKRFGMEDFMKKYIRKVKKYLLCDRKRKEEIAKQLESDIAIAMEHGQTFAAILKDMGTPKEVANEFNANFSGAEIRQAKKTKRVRLAGIGAVVVLVAALAIWWMLPKTYDIENSTIYNKQVVCEKAAADIQAFSAGNYDIMRSDMNTHLQNTLSADTLDKAKENIGGGNWGNYQSLGNAYAAEVVQLGKRYAVVQINASYEHVSVTYTLTFDKQMQLAGFYLK